MTVIAAWAERPDSAATAPVVWVLVREGDVLRLDCLQRDEQSAGMLVLFPVSDVVTREMTREAVKVLREAGR